MGDTLCSGIAYLLSCCCCCSSSDPGSDGSGMCSSSGKVKNTTNSREKAKEKELDQAFMDRGYRKDVAGHIHVEQPSTSQMMAAVHHPNADSELVKDASVEPAKELGGHPAVDPKPPQVGDPS